MKPHGNLKSYALGFGLSLLLTLIAYFLVVGRDGTGLALPLVVSLLAMLAVIQFIVQLHYFLHLGREAKPRWNLMLFGFMTLVLIIIVFGSLWIMNNLNYHMMSPSQTSDYIIQNEGIQR